MKVIARIRSWRETFGRELPNVDQMIDYVRNCVHVCPTFGAFDETAIPKRLACETDVSHRQRVAVYILGWVDQNTQQHWNHVASQLESRSKGSHLASR